jgi:hypothetical protein
MVGARRGRPLPTAGLKPATALGWRLVFSLVGVGLMAAQVNLPAAAIAGLTILIHGLVYTPLKRRTHWATEIGAISGALPPLLGNAAAGDLWAAWARPSPPYCSFGRCRTSSRLAGNTAPITARPVSGCCRGTGGRGAGPSPTSLEADQAFANLRLRAGSSTTHLALHMRKKIALLALLFAWLCANGALLDAVQVLAWAKMFAGYSGTMSAAAALERTFDPTKPCQMCLRVATAKKAAKQQLPAAIEQSSEKLILALHRPPPIIFEQLALAWPAALARVAPSRTEAVPVPPPRV